MSENQIEIIGQREIELLEKQRKVNLQQLFTPEGMESIIATIKKEVADFKADVSTKEGRAKIVSMAAKVAKCKSPIEKLAKEAKDESQKIIAGIQTQWKRYEAEMDALRDEIRKPVDEIEEKEAVELKARQDRLAEIERLSTTRAFNSVEDVKRLLSDLENLMAFEFGDFQFKADCSYDAARKYLESEVEKGIKYEAEQAELARLRREVAEREQKDREEKIAREAAEKAKREEEENLRRAEAAKKAAEERAKEAEELNRQTQRVADLLSLGMSQYPYGGVGYFFEDLVVSWDLIKDENFDWKKFLTELAPEIEKRKKWADAKKAKDIADEATQKERLRIAEEAEKKRIAEEKLAANKRHRAKINNDAKKAIKDSILAEFCHAQIGEEQQEILAKIIVEAIAKGEVPHVQINY